jgi:hypothetical protein
MKYRRRGAVVEPRKFDARLKREIMSRARAVTRLIEILWQLLDQSRSPRATGIPQS